MSRLYPYLPFDGLPQHCRGPFLMDFWRWFNKNPSLRLQTLPGSGPSLRRRHAILNYYSYNVNSVLVARVSWLKCKCTVPCIGFQILRLSNKKKQRQSILCVLPLNSFFFLCLNMDTVLLAVSRWPKEFGLKKRYLIKLIKCGLAVFQHLWRHCGQLSAI